MAGTAIRDKPVLFSVAVGTSDITCMFAWISLYFPTLFGVAAAANCLNVAHRNSQGLVRISMAVQARGQSLVFSVERCARCTHVAPGAFGHDLVIVLLSGIIDVVLPMTAHAVDLVPDTLFLDSFKNGKMTLAALHRGKGFYVHLLRSCRTLVCLC